MGECGEEGCVWVSAGRRDVCGECGEEGCVWVCRGRKRRLCVLHADVHICMCVSGRRGWD